jgi:glutathione synthase/RimK-type ligase-like ATP-grasp enzyme
METIVRIKWDEPKQKDWLCPENIKIALSAYCVNTNFEVEEIPLFNKTSEVIKCGDKLYYDINTNSKMDVPSSFYVKLEGYFDFWAREQPPLSFYDYCLQEVKGKA